MNPSRRIPLAVIGLVLAVLSWCSEASACGGTLCRWCANHHHGVGVRGVANSPLNYYMQQSASYMQFPSQFVQQSLSYAQFPSQFVPQQQQYYVVQSAAQFGSEPQRFGLTDVATILGLLDRIRSGSGSSPPTSDSAEVRRLNERYDALLESVEQNTSGIDNLVRSESDLANRVQSDLDKLSVRVKAVESSVTAINNQLVTAAEELKNFAKTNKKEFLQLRLDEKQMEKSSLEELLKPLREPPPKDEFKKAMLMMREQELKSVADSIELLKKKVAE